MTSEDSHGPRHWMPFAPIVGSILAAIAWAVFILVYALFWSGRFNYFQDFIVTIVSLLVVGLLIALMWVVWGARRGWQGRWDSWQSD